PIYRSNYLLRALKIPAGEHKIEFKFHPEKFYTGDKIAMVSSLLLILAAAGSIFMAVKGGKKPA
ncbi:MAG: YfhO family protein, partial [Taibaiella sp.]|nr:YfhO family protein [Taibaiella sp.]